ncbi:unnamed protein product [Amaranthus hypochondriacus]
MHMWDIQDPWTLKHSISLNTKVAKVVKPFSISLETRSFVLPLFLESSLSNSQLLVSSPLSPFFSSW